MSSSPSTPAAPIDSATATNENTPQYRDELAVSDSQSYDQNTSSGDEVEFDTAPLPSSSSISDVVIDAVPLLSRLPKADIKPTWPDRLDERKIPACARWDPNHNIENIRLDLHWAGQHAFIKLYTRLLLKKGPGTSQPKGRNVYIFLYLERIHRLLFTAQPNIIPFGADTIALTFYLNRPPALIRPKTAIGFTEGAESTIRSLNGLIQQSCFTIYASIPQRTISHTWLQQLCEDITEHKFTSISQLAKWEALYRGSQDEAEMIEGDSLLEPVTDRDDSAAPRLPTYQEIELPPTHSTKRKLPYDESSAIGQTVHGTVQALNDILDAKLAAHQRRLEEMNSAHKREMEEMKRAMEEMRREMEEMRLEQKEMISREEIEDLENCLMNRMDGIDESIDNLPDTIEESVWDVLDSTPIYLTR